MSAETVFFFVTLPFAIYAAWGDMKFMKIRNAFNLTLFALFLVLGPLLLPLGEVGARLAVAACAFVLGFALNAAGVMGGGDAKYIAALIPFVAPADIYLFTFILSGCLLGAVVTHRLARSVPAVRRATPDWISWEARKFPMGLGLSGALILYLALRAFDLPLNTG